jgi:D-alanyl-D-alanine carboxypeptidase/D-alanyl-D-alanine-endopeptidase (penicillin-binding protein 4)
LRADFSQAESIRFQGAYPASCGEQKWPVAYVQPNTFAPRMVQAMWAQAGGKLKGQVRVGITPIQAKLWHEAPSLPMSDIVADINKFSNNVMAQVTSKLRVKLCCVGGNKNCPPNPCL